MPTQVLLGLNLALPWILIALLISRHGRALAQTLTPLAAIPALALAVMPEAVLELPWLMVGMRVGVDAVNAPFLLLAGLLWTAAGCYAYGYLADDPGRARFDLFYLLTLSGNLGLIVALDAASFYLFFALLTFAAYGLIVHDGRAESRWAGSVYLTLAVIGEALLLAAMLLIGGTLGNADLQNLSTTLANQPMRDWIIALVLIGFGIKMGAVPLHVWLPLAHPCAPTPASAVLSGIIIKAGLLGWLRFLPLGAVALPGWGELCLAIGLFSIFYGVLTGLPQNRAKTVLAYSSISQMGLLTMLLGIALTAPGSWPLLLAMMLLFSLHHGLAKGVLFLGVGMTASGRRWSGWLLLLPALALVGAPLTSGALAKFLLKDAADLAPGAWAEWLQFLLPFSSTATSLLMARFLYLAWPRGARKPLSAWMRASWLSLLAIALVLPWAWASEYFPVAAMQTVSPKTLTDNARTLAITVLLAVTAWGTWRAERIRLNVPEGDILALAVWLGRYLPKAQGLAEQPAAERRPLWRSEQGLLLLWRWEQRLRLWSVVGVLFLVLSVALVFLFVA